MTWLLDPSDAFEGPFDSLRFCVDLALELDDFVISQEYGLLIQGFPRFGKRGDVGKLLLPIVRLLGAEAKLARRWLDRGLLGMSQRVLPSREIDPELIRGKCLRANADSAVIKAA